MLTLFGMATKDDAVCMVHACMLETDCDEDLGECGDAVGARIFYIGQEARGLVKARRRADGVMEYKVRWHGCEKDADTWVESTSLPAKMIARYEKKMAEKKAAVAAAAAGTGAP